MTKRNKDPGNSFCHPPVVPWRHIVVQSFQRRFNQLMGKRSKQGPGHDHRIERGILDIGISGGIGHCSDTVREPLVRYLFAYEQGLLAGLLLFSGQSCSGTVANATSSLNRSVFQACNVQLEAKKKGVLGGLLPSARQLKEGRGRPFLSF